MDYCCEPEIAEDRMLRLLRIAATVVRYYDCEAGARRRGLPAPIQVLQGWTAQEYELCVEWLALEKWPGLVGVGSVCRRKVKGSNGILEIVDALDRVLPPGTQLHLFGVKSDALAALAGHPRVQSTDSMAWDFAARRKCPTGRTAEIRIACMDEWLEKQNKLLLHAGGSPQTTLQLPLRERTETDFEAQALEAIGLQYADLILSRDMEYLDAVSWAQRDAPIAMAIAHQRGRSESALEALDELFPGTSDRIRAMH